MKILVRYQSRSGNTRAAAEIIAKCLCLKAEPISTPINESVDVLFLGGGVYNWDADPALIEYLEELDNEKIGLIVAFTTTGFMNVTLNKIKEYANKAGIEVHKNHLNLKMVLKGNAAFGRKGGCLTAEQIDKITKFTSHVLADIQDLETR